MADSLDDLMAELMKTHPFLFRKRDREEFGNGEKELRAYMDRLDDIQPHERTTRYPWGEK